MGSPLPTIVVVSSDGVLRGEIETVIAACDHVSISCNDGVEALDRMGSMPRPPALIVLEWIPYGNAHMSGHEFLARYASNPRLGRTPIVVIASQAAQDIPRLCVSGLLRRPVSAMSLIETIAKHAARAARTDA